MVGPGVHNGLFVISALVLGFTISKVHAFEANRYNYRDHPDYIHVAQGDDAVVNPAPPMIDCETDFKDNDAEVVDYLVSICLAVLVRLCAWG